MHRCAPRVRRRLYAFVARTVTRPLVLALARWLRACRPVGTPVGRVASGVAWGVALGAALVALPAWSQLARNFPATALRGEVQFIAPPEVTLNGEPARLAPGVRIHGEDRMLRLPATLAGRTATVHYTREATTGLLREVWFLNPAELAREPWPSTEEEARRWRFDPAAQTWSRP